ncbi:ATP-NAD kinase, partial [Escherichia coli]|uniref:hypothetical protein n=1 Tax=Escherichia coli TaxID=562 RepID=UPI000FF0DA70
NKRLLVREPRRGLCEWALVDVAVSPQPFIGARAISRAEDLAEVFVSFAEPATDRPSITLDPSGPFSVDVPATLAYAARHRLLAGQRTPMTP